MKVLIARSLLLCSAVVFLATQDCFGGAHYTVDGVLQIGASDDCLKNWEQCRRARTLSDSNEMSEAHKMLATDKALLLRVVDPAHRAEAENYDLKVIPEPTTIFLINSVQYMREGQVHWDITVSYETWITLTKIALAAALVNRPGLAIDESWLARYLLYMRSVPDGDTIQDPFRAAGYVKPDGSVSRALTKQVFSESIDEAYGQTKSMMLFFLGHEFYHLAHPLNQASGETSERFKERQRADELLADAHSLDLLHKLDLAQVEKESFFVGAPTLIFLQWILVMEGSRHKLGKGTHPLDHERVREATQIAVGLLPSEPVSADTRARAEKTAQKIIRLTKEIDAEGPTNYFNEINKEASEVTLDTLRIDSN